MPQPEVHWSDVNAAFSKQSTHFDDDDLANPILQRCREQVYAHVDRLIKPDSSILELNAGTGIDAIRFAGRGHTVCATDLSDGMIKQMKKKLARLQLEERVSVRQLSFDQLNELKGKKFDYVFSNFGGLNCMKDLHKITEHLQEILNPGGYVTWVIMPPVCPWEILGLLKGNPHALRRFSKNGVAAHLEGEYFRVWYHSLGFIKKSFGDRFKLIHHEGLAAISPPPHASSFAIKHPALDKILYRADASLRNHFPFNRWADHVIVSFQFIA